MIQTLIHLLLAVFPVVLFLLTLVYLDSYKLLRPRLVLLLVLAGAGIATLCFFPNSAAFRIFAEPASYRRYGAPILEESLKALPLAFLILRKRIGFLIDAAICGFAIGTGFAVLENLYYLSKLADSEMIVWIVRGFGTALMHGGNSAIFAVLSKARTEDSDRWTAFLPGLVVAILIHSFFNHFLLSPTDSTLAILLLLPALVLIAFQRSEKAVQKWLGVSFDADAQLLELIHSGKFGDSKIGQYLQSLKEHFSGLVLADMLCYLRISVELGMRAKGILLARQNGFEVKVGSETERMLQEVGFLERSIGKTGRLAMQPFLDASRRDAWQMALLGGAKDSPR